MESGKFYLSVSLSVRRTRKINDSWRVRHNVVENQRGDCDLEGGSSILVSVCLPVRVKLTAAGVCVSVRTGAIVI